MKKYIYAFVAVILALVIWFGVHRLTTKKSTTIETPSQGRYVALGDSVAAGVGLQDYSDSSACDRTKQAYPNVIAQKRHYKMENVACSGATTKNGLLGPQIVNELALAPQIVTPLFNGKPSLVTLTIGANDANWTTYIQKCYVSVCGTTADTDSVNASLSTLSANIGDALSQIKRSYPAETPPVLVTGYYRLFPTSPQSNCIEMTGIDRTELAWINMLQTKIDDSLKTATTNYNFAKYVPIRFQDHELCTSDPWIQGLTSKAPYHPTDSGQASIADQILQSLGTN